MARTMTGSISHPQNLSRCAGEVETRSGEGEGDRAASLYLLRCGPITLTLGATHHRPPPPQVGRGLVR